ncbi:hypothetical protein Tco_0380006, partial [Tanacetum coccineum]
DSFIVSNKRSFDSSKKLKGIQTLTFAEQEAADIMKDLKESKKMSKRQPGTGGSNEGTGNILGVPDESTFVSRASSKGTRFKPGVPDEEKLILEWEADVDSLLFVKNHSLQLSPPTSALQQSRSAFEMAKSQLLCKSVQDLRLL